MAKRSKNKGYTSPNQQSQPTKVEMVSKLVNKSVADKEQQILADARVQEKIVEYEQLIQDNEFKFKEDRIKFQKEYEERRKDIQSEYETKLNLINDEKENVELQKQNLEKDRVQMVNDIKSQEEDIRKSHKEALMANWEKEYNEKTKDIDILTTEAQSKAKELHAAALKELIDSKQESHEIRVESEEERIRTLDETRTKIEQNYQQVAKEFEDKLQELIKKDNLLKKQQQNLNLQEEDFEIDKEMVKLQQQLLKQQLEKCSPVKVEELNSAMKILEIVREHDQIQIEKLTKDIIHLKQFVSGDETRNVETILSELESQRTENQKLRDELANIPSSYELEELRGKSDNIENLSRILEDEKRQRLEAEQRADSLSIGVIELEQNRKMAETLKTLNAQLQDELSKINDMYKQNTTSKYPSLLDIDKKLLTMPSFRAPITKKSLNELINYIRAYGANKENLYYSEKTIRCFIASLAASKLLILQGLSGTGKSSLPRLFKEALSFESSLVPVQPSWRDNRELLGYDNDFTKRFKETEFTKFLYEASAIVNKEKIWFIVLDEMNLARIEYYFADFLSILEKKPEEWVIPLVANNEEINQEKIPKYLINGTSLKVSENIWFIGTANRDESTFGITDKVYDRAQVLDFKSREDAFEMSCDKNIKISYSEFNNLLEKAIKDKSLCLDKEDWAKLDGIDKILKEKLDITFGNRIKMQMDKFVPVYVACGGSKEEALDYLLTHKVLRKLENRYETYLKDSLKELIEVIDSQYGKNTFVESITLIEQKIQRLGG